VTLEHALPSIPALDEVAMDAARRHLDRLTKPPGSLGRLEELVVLLAGITGRVDAPLGHRRIVLAAGDHGVTAQHVSAYPSGVTAQMVGNFVAGGAAINALAASIGATVTVVDVGVAGPLPPVTDRGAIGGRLVLARLRDGTADLSEGPAMSRRDAVSAIEVGLRVVEDVRERERLDVLGVGEMGIGNTTSASAIVAAFTGLPADRVTGRGTGVDDATLRHKVRIVERALEANHPDPGDPIGTLAALGGFEVAALVGLIVGGAAARVPVILDGFITGAAALVADALCPAIAGHLIASHRSVEAGHAAVLERLALRPLLDLDLRLGEGTGAALAMPLLVAAGRMRDQMATFDSASVAGRAG
jgi:nicotinate-nucleotide--dimethylbenzimidazole phosphoribosyltransferase